MCLTACPVEAASLVAEKTGAGVPGIVVITEVASVRRPLHGLNSAGIASIRSVCPIICCCSQRFIFLCLEVFGQLQRPLSFDVDNLHVTQSHIIVSQMGWPVVLLPNVRSP